MEDVCKQYIESFKININGCFSGLIKSEEKYESFLLELFSKGFSFSKRSSGNRSTDKLMFTKSGFPCTTVQRIYFQCCYGDLYYKINKSKEKEEDHSYEKKRRIRNRNTKKMGCPSKLHVKIRHVYPEYHADRTTLTKWMKMKMSAELKSKITQDSARKETWYFIDGLVEHNHEISVEALPDKLKDNPINKIVVLETQDKDVEENTELYQQSEQLPSESCQKTSNHLDLLREELTSLINLTYNVDEGANVSHLLDQVSAIKKELDGLQKKEVVIPLLKTNPMKRKRGKSSKNCSVLRQPPKQKHINKSQGIVVENAVVVESAEMLITALNCDLDAMYFVTV